MLKCILSSMSFLKNGPWHSKRNLATLVQACSVTNENFIKHLNCRTIVSNERKGEPYKNIDKVTRTLIAFKYQRLIKNAIRESGPVLKNNEKLAYFIEMAQRNRISPDSINFFIRMSVDTRAQVGFFDVFLPNGCHFLVQYEDIDPTTTKHHLLNLCERYDGNLIQGDTFWPKSFEIKGMVFIKCSDLDPFVAVPKNELISKHGIESYNKDIDVEGIEYWKVLCDPWKLHQVRKYCQSLTENMEEAYVGFIPKKIVQPSHHTRNSIYNILYKLSEVPTIGNVFCNINLTHFRS